MDMRIKRGNEMYELGLRLGVLGPVAIGAAGGTLAVALARCVGCGIALAGGEARFHDGSCAACGVWLTSYYGLPAGVFLRQEGSRISLFVTDGKGEEFTPAAAQTVSPCTGSWDLITGADSGWAAHRAAGRVCRRTVAAEGPPALRLLLERMGCDVLDRPQSGIPLLRADREGFRLSVECSGMTVLPPGVDAPDAAARWLSEGKAVPAFGTELV